MSLSAMENWKAWWGERQMLGRWYCGFKQGGQGRSPLTWCSWGNDLEEAARRTQALLTEKESRIQNAFPAVDKGRTPAVDHHRSSQPVSPCLHVPSLPMSCPGQVSPAWEEMALRRFNHYQFLCRVGTKHQTFDWAGRKKEAGGGTLDWESGHLVLAVTLSPACYETLLKPLHSRPPFLLFYNLGILDLETSNILQV